MKVKRAGVMWCVMAVICAGGVVASMLGCGGVFCEVPEGTYDLKVAESTGDCPQELLDEIEESIENDPIVVDAPDNGCGEVAVTFAEYNEASMCNITVSGFADGTEEGISNFEATLTLEGANCSFACNQVMQLEATRR